jgi:hypothetical protein
MSRQLPDYPDWPELTGTGAVDRASLMKSSTVMKALPGFSRNDIVRLIALVSVVAFPLIADAQFGPVTRPLKASTDVLPAASATAASVAAGRDSCADQHWPFFSQACLRGSTETIEPRLVSMNAESTPNAAPATEAAKAVAIDTTQGNAPFAKSKKPARPRTATRMRERKIPNVSYAVNSAAGNISPAGW